MSKPKGISAGSSFQLRRSAAQIFVRKGQEEPVCPIQRTSSLRNLRVIAPFVMAIMAMMATGCKEKSTSPSENEDVCSLLGLDAYRYKITFIPCYSAIPEGAKEVTWTCSVQEGNGSRRDYAGHITIQRDNNGQIVYYSATINGKTCTYGTLLPPPPPPPRVIDLFGVFSVSGNILWVTGSDATVRKSTDGGVSWQTLSNDTTFILYSVFFTDANKGIAVGGRRDYPNIRSRILKTTDGGSSWTTTLQNTSYALFSVHFPNSNVGYAVGTSGTILKTIDGGSSWTKLTTNVNTGCSSVFFLSADTGFVAGSIGTFLKTTNGGSSWSVDTIGTKGPLGFNYSLYSVRFVSSTRGYVAGEHGSFLTTINGGTTWTAKSLGSSDLNALSFASPDIGYAVGAGGLIGKTTNGGTTWTWTSRTADDLHDVYFSSTQNGSAVGNKSTILTTSDGGVTWVVR